MGFFYTSLPPWVTVGTWITAVILVVLAFLTQPFKRLQNETLQHVWFAIIVAITVLWASNAWFDEGPVMHVLGATLVVTLFDWALALIALAAVCGIAAVIFDTAWQGVGLTFVIYSAVPIGVSVLFQRACVAWLPRNWPVFICTQGFISPAIAASVASFAALGAHLVLTQGSTTVVPVGYTFNVFLLVIGEAWLTGAATTLIAVYKPAWVTTNDVQRYRLGGPRP